MVKESPKCQEMGPKKYGEYIRKQNAFYDKYKAGKKDPKTGEYYHHISGKDPSKPSITYSNSGVSTTIGYVKCKECEADLWVGSNSVGRICLYCAEYNYFSIEMKDELKRKMESEEETSDREEG